MLERSPHANPPRHRADEEPAPWWRALDRRRLQVAVGVTALAMPILVLDNLPARADSPDTVETASPTTSTLPERLTTTTTIVVTTTSTTAPVPTTTATTAPRRTTTTTPPTTAPRRTATTQAPATTAPPTTVAQLQPVAPVTTAPPTTVPPAPPAAGGSTESGKATWYHWNPGECAHKTIPKGTTVTVTNVATGATTTCVVTDRGPYGPGRIIDLDATVFDDLASLGTGVINVVITW